MNDIFAHNMPEEAAEAHLGKMENIFLHRSGYNISREELAEILKITLKERAKKIVVDYINSDLAGGPNAYQVLLRAQKTSTKQTEEKASKPKALKATAEAPKEQAS